MVDCGRSVTDARINSLRNSCLAREMPFGITSFSKEKIMQEITKTEVDDGYIYSMPSSCGFGDVVIEVEAEVGGHGCLFGIKLPVISIDSSFHSGNSANPELNDVMHVLNRVFTDYHCQHRVTTGMVKEI